MTPMRRRKVGLLAVMVRTGSINVLVYLWAFSCLVIVQGNQFPQNDLSRWAVVFFSWGNHCWFSDNETHCQSGTCTLRMVSYPDIQENLLYLKLGGYISSALAAGRWQLGPSSRYQRAKWSLELCCCWTPRSGLLGNLGSSQKHLVDFTQIVFAEDVAGSLVHEIFGCDKSQVSAEHTWSLLECSLSP